MWSVWGNKAQEREREDSPCNVCDKASKSLPTPNQNKIWQLSGHVFVWQVCGKKFNPNNIINIHKKLVCGKPHHRKRLCIFSMLGKDYHWTVWKTIEEIDILNIPYYQDPGLENSTLSFVFYLIFNPNPLILQNIF